MKSTTPVIGPDEPIILPKVAPGKVDFEADLALVIGKAARHAPESHALEYVPGYNLRPRRQCAGLPVQRRPVGSRKIH